MLCGAIECSPLADKRTCGFGMSCVRLGCAFDHPEGQHHTLLNYQEFEEMRQSRRQRFLSKPGGVCHTMMADVVATAEDGTLQTDGNVLGSLQSKSELLCGGIVALKGQIQQIKTKLNMCFKALVQVGVDIRNDVYHSLLRVKADSATEEMFDQVKDSYNTLAVEVKELHDKLSGNHHCHTRRGSLSWCRSQLCSFVSLLVRFPKSLLRSSSWRSSSSSWLKSSRRCLTKRYSK